MNCLGPNGSPRSGRRDRTETPAPADLGPTPRNQSSRRSEDRLSRVCADDRIEHGPYALCQGVVYLNGAQECFTDNGVVNADPTDPECCRSVDEPSTMILNDCQSRQAAAAVLIVGTGQLRHRVQFIVARRREPLKQLNQWRDLKISLWPCSQVS